MNDNNRIYLQGVGPHDPPFPWIPKIEKDTYQEYIRCSNCCSMCTLSSDTICEISRQADSDMCREWFSKDSHHRDGCLDRVHQSYKGCLRTAAANCTRSCRCTCSIQII